MQTLRALGCVRLVGVRLVGVRLVSAPPAFVGGPLPPVRPHSERPTRTIMHEDDEAVDMYASFDINSLDTDAHRVWLTLPGSVLIRQDHATYEFAWVGRPATFQLKTPIGRGDDIANTVLLMNGYRDQRPVVCHTHCRIDDRATATEFIGVSARRISSHERHGRVQRGRIVRACTRTMPKYTPA